MPEKQYFTGIDVVNAPRIESLTVTEDGTYTASSGVIGYNPVVVNTSQPWEPLEDGYSNFWFELTNDTLSPWLNFSAKNNDAVIDWGDGSGEVALDTLTPTHTYSKAGKYVVKVKGVTGVGQQHNVPYNGLYLPCLKYVELNNDVISLQFRSFCLCVGLTEISLGNITTLGTYSFQECSGLINIKIPSSLSAVPSGVFQYCKSLSDVEINANILTLKSYLFYNNMSLPKITIPSSVTAFEAGVFDGCQSLSEIHILSTSPASLGNNVFNNLYSTYIIYVPVGTAETYKAASGWSTYADHILEEGQEPTRMMLAKFNNNTDNEDMR